MINSKEKYIKSINERAYNFMMGMNNFKFSFETSLGEVICEAKIIDSVIIFNSEEEKVKSVDIQILKGEGHIDELFRGSISPHFKQKWIQIDLYDSYDGVPEYKIKILDNTLIY